ncbi:hypothetical protein GCM10022224_098310 [Nonomuraea antimicrobica]|uniref:Resolvase/invertase-type recombinase catalytic domain-containing protein n=1 Tax=Nonomuraea antimicrobica TaxID=561173 RepID=A0ABP7EE85_9ACTN
MKIISLTENFDFDTIEGRFMFTVLAAASEYELELRAERQAEGIEAAKRREADGVMLPGKKRTGADPPSLALPNWPPVPLGRRRRLCHRSRPHLQDRQIYRLHRTRRPLTSSYLNPRPVSASGPPHIAHSRHQHDWLL